MLAVSRLYKIEDPRFLNQIIDLIEIGRAAKKLFSLLEVRFPRLGGGLRLLRPSRSFCKTKTQAGFGLNPFHAPAWVLGFTHIALLGGFCIITAMDATKVLIVEDEHFLSTILANRLKKEGFDINQVFDGEEAINFLKAGRPNLIVLDLILPKKSGFEVLESISKDPQLSQIPVVILSNLGQESDIEKAKSLGAAEYYIKVRTSVDNFTEIVRSILSRFQGGATVQNPQ